MTSAAYAAGAPVIVRASFPPGHTRAPSYIRGRSGVVDGLAGRYANPEELAYGRSGMPLLPVYRVRFRQSDLWSDYKGADGDTVVVDVYGNWIEPVAGRAP